MANELSRVGDRLTRARERSASVAAQVLIPAPARREPSHAEIPSQLRRDAGAAPKRAPATLVAIHVEVRHPTGDAEPTARVIDAHVSELDDAPERYVDVASEIDDGPERPALVADLSPPVAEVAPMFALPGVAAYGGTTGKQARSSGLLYMAVRAISAYLKQHSFSAPQAAEPLVDLRA